MNAVWITDYDYSTDKCFKRPGCPECKEPVLKDEDGLYYCVSCGKAVDVTDEKKKAWFEKRAVKKIEYWACIGCGGEKTMEVHFRKNPANLKWQPAYGRCIKCGARWIV